MSSYVQMPPPPAGSRSYTAGISSPSDHSMHQRSPHLPKVGETRCYWALLSYPHMHFAYVDPILQSHLDEDANLILGHSLLEFVHPEDQEQVRRDLGSFLESNNPYGSETRVRFCRLSRVKSMLSGESSGTRNPPPYTNKPWATAISIDDNYMTVNLAINCPLRSTVLCFIHAAVDLDPGADNDLAARVSIDGQRKRGWTNWCGTGHLGSSELRDIWSALTHIQQANQNARSDTDILTEKFQFLSNTPQHEVLISWPPDPGSLADQRMGLMAQDFAKLATNVAMDSGQSDNAKTSCTRRHRSQRSLITAQRSQVDVESMYIPHGTIIFACHKVISVASLPSNPNQDSSHPSMSRHSPLVMAYPPSSSHLPIDSNSSQQHPSQSPYLPPPSSTPHYNTQYSYSPSGQTSTNGSGRWSEYSVPNGSSTTPSTTSNATRTPSHWGHDRAAQYSAPWSNGGHDATRSLIGQGYGRTSPDGYPSYGSQAGSNLGDQNHLDDIDKLAPLKRRLSPTSSARDSYPDVAGPGPGQDTTPSSSKRHGARPPGLMRCTSCKATTSPEWRKGPNGKKELCNACGLRYARSKAKKEGSIGRKKKNDKSIKSVVFRDTPSPVSPATPASASAPAPTPVSHASQTPPPLAPPLAPPPAPQQSYIQAQTNTTPSPSVSTSNFLLQQYGNSQQYPASPHQTAYYNAAAGLASLNQYSYDRGSYPVNDRVGSYERVSPSQAYDRESREREQERHRQRDRESRLKELDSPSDGEYRRRSELPSGRSSGSGSGNREGVPSLCEY